MCTGPELENPSISKLVTVTLANVQNGEIKNTVNDQLMKLRKYHVINSV